MQRGSKKNLARVISLALAFVFMSSDALALVKEVNVGGARSINDLGYSDNRVTMEELQDDYADYNSTDWLREYFHTDQDEPYKVDLSEALSWLISNEIISRDQTVTVSNIGSNQIPSVSISKFDANSLNGMTVNRSDAIMYLYKAVFGPIDARTIGVETPNIRVDDGRTDTLYNIMLSHDYFSNIAKGLTDGIFQFVEGSEGGSPGQGGDSGDASQEIITTINESSIWRYTPQGTLYDSIFGDTNIFISEVEINQSVTGGDGGDGGDGYNGGIGGGGGAGGSAVGGLQYETDYKQIYYVPGADLMFYRTNDVLEVYLRAALSKGLLQTEASLRTDKFDDTFVKDAKTKTSLNSWSQEAPAYIFNRSTTKQTTSANVDSVAMSETLGVNYTLLYSGTSATISRNNLFQSNSGYFTTEKIYKMTLYRYIYDFVYANEKKMSDLEADIVNYKYGMELDGMASAEDIEVLKYLIAKGILDFDNTVDFQGLYSTITYDDFIPILYRVAKPDARLDFSKVQLTDSDQHWKARGYAPQTLYLTAGGGTGRASVSYSDDVIWSWTDDGMDDITSSDPRVVQAWEQVTGQQFSLGESDNDGSYLVTQSILADAAPVTFSNSFDVSVQSNAEDIVGVEGFNFSFNLVHFSSETMPSILSEYLTPIERMYSNTTMLNNNHNEYLYNRGDGDYDPISVFSYEVLHNIFVVSYLVNNPSVVTLISQELDDLLLRIAWKYGYVVGLDDEGTSVSEDYSKFKQGITFLKSTLTSVTTGAGRVTSVSFTLEEGTSSQTVPMVQNVYSGKEQSIRGAGGCLTKVDVTITDDTGTRVSYTVDRAAPKERLTQNSINDALKSANDVPLTVTRSYTGVDAAGMTMDEAITDFLSHLSSTEAIKARAYSECWPQYASTNSAISQQFVSWEDICDYNANVTDSSKLIPIEKVSDLVLHNTETDTYAYFSVESDKMFALVGTEVVVGDPGYGTYLTDNNGAYHYYHVDVIRLLINAKQESALLSGMKTLTLAQENVVSSISMVPMTSESGYTGGSLVGIRAMLSNNDSATVAANPTLNGNPYYFAEDADGDDTRWGNFISLSQANRVGNTISRKFSYEGAGTGTGNYSAFYAIVAFKPADIEAMGGTTVDPSMSLQDLLDAPTKQPDSEEGKRIWAQNKEECNTFANWIYGTQGKTYVETGYLVPDVYVFYESSAAEVPIAYFSSLGSLWTDGTRVHKYMLSYQSEGAVVPVGTTYSSLTGNQSSQATYDDKYKASYWLSSNYMALVEGDRVYIHEAFFDNLVGINGSSGYRYSSQSKVIGSSQFTVGGKFKLTGWSSDAIYVDDPTALVTAVDDDGKITCQFGPIIGVPIRYNSVLRILDTNNLAGVNVTLPYNSIDFEHRYLKLDKLAVVKNVIESGAYAGVDIVGVTQDPDLIVGNPLVPVTSWYNGSSINSYNESKSTLVGYPTITPQDTLTTIYTSMSKSLQSKLAYADINNCRTYITLQFSGFDFTVKDGVLVAEQATTLDYLSPALYTSLNDTIIDEMINTAHGAIPINDIPADSLLELGSGFVCAIGNSSDNKRFVGYSPVSLSSYTTSKPKVQDLKDGLGGQYIRAGNQYMSVTHFFAECNVIYTYDTSAAQDLERTDHGDIAQQQKALGILADTKLKSDGTYKQAIYGSGGIKYIYEGKPEENVGYTSNVYAPFEVKFFDLLYAYPVTDATSEGSTYTVYRICPNAETSCSGSLDEVPFWSSAVLDLTVRDRTLALAATAYVTDPEAATLMSAIKKDFQKVFAGDLFTLVRMIVFIVTVWLVLSSWVCYGFYYGRLMPILEAIRHPTVNNSNGGLDLMKVMSLGTISMDSDFKLGKFIQYNFILAAVLLIVWKSGSITF